MVYEIMHKDRVVARIDNRGKCKIYFTSFMPYHLYLEEKEDFDTLVDNVTNFNYWCATRVLTLDRKYAKEILNSVGLQQMTTDRDRAKMALSYRCLSLADVFWVRMKGEKVRFADVNLFENHLDNTFIDIALRGKQYTANNNSLARDLSTNGCYPKAWKRTDKGFVLLKDGDSDAVSREVLASRICRCFDVDQVRYELGEFGGEPVSVSWNITSLEYSIAPMNALEIKLTNQERDIRKYIMGLDRKNYHMMNIVDYLVGNTDRHWGNWGVLVNNKNNHPVKLHPLMDFNQAFNGYRSIEGANCQTAFGRKLSQMEAAIEGVKAVGLNQVAEIPDTVFDELDSYREMFAERLSLLKEIERVTH